jgi:hypothetical protein
LRRPTNYRTEYEARALHALGEPLKRKYIRLYKWWHAVHMRPARIPFRSPKYVLKLSSSSRNKVCEKIPEE